MIDEWIYMSKIANYSSGTPAKEGLKCKIPHKSAWFFDVAILQLPNFNKEHHPDELLALLSELPNLADLWYRFQEVNMPPLTNKSAAGIAWCPATMLTSSEVTVLNLCTSSSHALYCTKFWEIIWNDIKVIEWTWFLYWKLQREIILQKDTISILTIYKITKWHNSEKNVEG